MKEAKIILYPIFGVFQFVLAADRPWPACLLFYAAGIGLIGLSIVYLREVVRQRVGGKK